MNERLFSIKERGCFTELPVSVKQTCFRTQNELLLNVCASKHESDLAGLSEQG